MDPESVRKLVAEALRQAGVPIVVEQSITFSQLYQFYFDLEVIPRELSQSNFKYFLPKVEHWNDRQIHTISKTEVNDWFIGLAKDSGKPSANRAISVLSRIINWGIHHEYLPAIQNPCKGVKKFKTRSRERFLSVEEVQRLSSSLDQEPEIWRDFFWMCLLTAARLGNVLAMKWEQIDLTGGVWRIPKTKNGESLTVPLTDAALAILQRRKERDPDDTWVFPGKKGGQNGHLSYAGRAFKRITERAQITNIRIHDLRRTRASHMAIAGMSIPVIGQLLGHIDSRSTAVYARLNLDPIREGTERIDEEWRALTSLPKRQPRLSVVENFSTQATGHPATTIKPKSEKLFKNSNVRITGADELIIKGKILTVLKSGGKTKKQMYQKIGSKQGINSEELDRILTEMIEANLVYRYRDVSSRNWHIWKYSLVDATDSEGISSTS